MAKKLSEDELKWILSIDATEAQQSIRALSKDNNKLNASNKELKERMISLIATGKKESEEYKNLSIEVALNNERIDHNKAKIKSLEGTLGLAALTMGQLRKQARDLQRQLDFTSQATHPEEYGRLERNLSAVRNRMGELRTSGERAGNALSTSLSNVGTVVKGFLALRMADYMRDIVTNAINTRKEFAKYETVLRNTFQSQEKAAQAMAMLKNLAQETPYSLQEVTEAYIKMVNRGIIPTHDELTKLGDLASSQGKSLDQLIEAILDAQTGEFERLKEFGIKANKENDKVRFSFKGITTEVAFTEKAISGYLYSLGELKGVQGGMAAQMEGLEGHFSNLGDTIDGLMNRIGARLEPFVKSILGKTAAAIQDISKELAPANEAFQEQFDKVVALERQLPGLTSRYETLKSKTNLSKVEQQELNDTIAAISRLAPGAITAFDQYGKALDINTAKVQEYLEAERLRLQFMNEGQIKSTEAQIKGLTKQKERLQAELNAGGTYFPGSTLLNPLTPEEKGGKEKEILRLGNLLTGANEELRRLNAQSLQDQIDNQKKKAEKQTEFNQMTKRQLQDYIEINKEASDKYVEIAQEIFNNKFKEDTKPTTPKETKNALDLDLRKQENAHTAELTILRETKIKESQSESFYNLQRLSSDTKFYQDRLKLLHDYQKKTTDPKLQEEITKSVNDTQVSILDTQVRRDEETIRVLKDNRDKRLKVEEQSNKTQQAVFEKKLVTKQITQQQYDLLTLSAEVATTKNRLRINQDYQSDVESLELASGNVKAKAVEEANQAVMEADLRASKARSGQLKEFQKAASVVSDFKGKFNLLTPEEETSLQLEALKASYEASLELAKGNATATAELDAAYERAKTQILQQEEDKRNQIRTQYGLLSMQAQYDLEMEQLKKQHDQGLLSEEEYQKAKSQIKVKYLKDSFDYYANMFSGAINALQQAELDNIDAKYDAEIQRAGDNTEEVARLEKEKEAKKLEVQKKYAGVQFAIKVSEIIANTAVAIMQAFAQLGPIGGAIAAAMLGVTGVAQIATANAERKKIMNMTVDNAGGGSSGGTASRVVTGKQSGGYMDVTREQDGKEFHATLDPGKRGFIDKPTVIVGEGPAGYSKEWVASNAALENPTVRPFINVLNEAQEKGEIRTVDMNQMMRKRLAGFESGGPIDRMSGNTPPVPRSPQPGNTPKNDNIDMSLLKTILQKLDNLRAYVVYSDLEAAKSTLDKSKKIGGK